MACTVAKPHEPVKRLQGIFLIELLMRIQQTKGERKCLSLRRVLMREFAVMNNSLLKSIDVLMEFSRSTPTMSVTELSTRLGLPKSTTHRILTTLLFRGLVEKLPHEQYALGKAIIALSQSVWVNVNIRDRAAAVARSLAEESRESVYVGVQDNDAVLYVYAVETSQRLTARTAVGDRAPFHCTAVGKAMLANFPDAKRAAILDASPLIACTPKTITDPNRLYDELDLIRKRGFAVDDEEHEPDTLCIAAPFLEAENRVVGAISVSGRHESLITSQLSERSQQVVQAARAISLRLGFVESRPSTFAPALARS
jgi:DNA-binding IclR family transcriptional regulator